MDLCLQGGDDLCMCSSQMTLNMARISVFLDHVDNLLIFYQAFCVNLMWNFVAGWACTSIRDCASIRTYTVHTLLLLLQPLWEFML